MTDASSPELLEPSQIPLKSGGRVAVSLESSFLGFFAHAGFLNSLVDSGIRPSQISGASSGSMVASAYASGLEGDELKDFVLDRKLQRSFREWGLFLRAPAMFITYIGHGLVSGKRAVKHLRKKLPIAKIEDTPNAKLSISVTNLTKKEGQLIYEGDMAAYIVASCALTPILQAQKIDGELFLDGGFSDEAPFEQWIDDSEVDVIIIHRIKFSPEYNVNWSKYTNFLSCWGALHQVVSEGLMERRLARVRAAGKQVIIHESRMPRPKLIASKQASARNYQTAYETWQKTPSAVLGD